MALTVAGVVTLGGLAFAPSPAGAAGTPEISIGDASIHEGDAGKRVIRLMVNLDRVPDTLVTTNWSTSSGSAGDDDYKGRSGRLRFNAGAHTTRYIKIIVKPDAAIEGTEQFTVSLSGVVGAIVVDGTGVATILDDELTNGAAASIGDMAVREGDDGDSRYVFLAVSLNQPAGTTASVTFTTGGGTAASPTDYIGRTHTITFGPRTRVKYALVYVTPDLAVDGTKTFNVTLSSPVNVTIGDGTGTVTLVDDD